MSPTAPSRTLPLPVSVVMPVCNEADVIESVLAEWHTAVMTYLPAGSEMLLDDGASDDGTLDILRARQKAYPYLRVLRSRREGFGAAARRLYAEARCPLVFFTDSDGQYVPEDFWKVAALYGTADMIHGYKVGRSDPYVRLLASQAFNALARHTLQVPYRDINSAFRLVSRALVMSQLPRMHCMKTLFNAELLVRLFAEGHTIAEVPVRHRARQFGASRGLPPQQFLSECRKAYGGLRQLRREFWQTNLRRSA